MNNYDKITDKLYIGNMWSLNDIIRDKPPITHIISFISVQPHIKDILKANNITYYEYLFDDSYKEKIIDRYNDIKDIIQDYLINQNGVVMVLCHAGRSRSASIAILILMNYYDVSFESALKYINARRMVQLNRQFHNDLQMYSQSLK